MMAVKDQLEIKHIRRSAFLAATVMRDYAVQEIESRFPIPLRMVDQRNIALMWV